MTSVLDTNPVAFQRFVLLATANVSWHLTQLDHEVFFVGQAAAIAADAIVLVVTWYRTYHTVRVSRTVYFFGSRPIFSVLLRDGDVNSERITHRH